MSPDTPHDAADPLVTARQTAAARAAGDDHAAPAITVTGRLIQTPDFYPVRTPGHRDRDYADSLPADLGAAIDKLDAAKLGPGGRQMLTGGPTPAKQRTSDDDYLGPTAARVESVRAALALLVDETAAHVIETTTALDPEPWTHGGTRVPGRREPGDPAVKPVIALSTAADRVVAPSHRGTSRELPSKWPPSAAGRWWEDTLKPAVEALPGMTTTAKDDPRGMRTWVRFTDAYEHAVRRGVLAAADVDAALADALDVADPTVEVAILGADPPAADDGDADVDAAASSADRPEA